MNLDDLGGFDDAIAYAKTLREALPDTFHIVEQRRSRIGRYKAVHPGGWYKTNDRQKAEDWLWLCSLNLEDQ